MTFKRITEFFEDGQYLSAFRLVYVLWAAGVFLVWSGLNVYNCAVLHSSTMVGLNPTVLAFLGTLTGGKILQNVTENRTMLFSENKSPGPQETH